VDSSLFKFSPLHDLVGCYHVLSSPEEILVYEYDASVDRGNPQAVVLPTSAEQVSAIVKLCNRFEVPFVARGAGTNLSGGSLPIQGGVVIGLSRMNHILEMDIPNQRAVVEPGVVNLDISAALAPLGYYFAPDPASQKASTIGGNVAENAGGPHCLKYGVTTNHILGLEVVTPEGEILQFGGKALDTPGYDLTGLFVGSEGTLGIATKIVVRILRLPETYKTLLVIYDSLEDAGRTVSAIIAAGILPATLEMMDRIILGAVEASFHAGFRLDAEGVLLIELDGLADGMERAAERIERIRKENHARELRVAKSAAERDKLWAGRKGAFGAIARVSPNYLVVDGTVPRTKLPEVLSQVYEIGRRYDLRIPNVFHAGDGNLHPLILFDDRNKEQKEKVMRAGMELLKLCAAAGGTITGEHGIGLEKIAAMSFVFGPPEMSAMRRVKQAFDPGGRCNPGKVLPP
jgi:glycolate dehydrogenase FAD-linked subunit